MNYYEEIKNKIIDNEIYCKVKDYSKQRNTVNTYYEVGKLLTEAGKTYGESIIENYSKKLLLDVGKKYNARTLRRMRKLYLFFETPFISNVIVFFGKYDLFLSFLNSFTRCNFNLK